MTNKELTAAHERFARCVEAWDAANSETIRAYGAWQTANERRLALAIEKNNAWGALQLAKAEAGEPADAL